MSEAQPLSRRERRAMEEAARAAEGDETQALPIAPETESVVSRRERRRMERLAHPVETWTAEEEMIATGQMPAMTPEVIAEQEQLARERAAAADADARAAAAYAETAPVEEAVAEPDAVVESAPEPAPEPAPVADAVVESAPEPAPVPAPVNDGIPADLRHLFPPGSLQARAFEAQQAVVAPEPTSDEAVEEIRRLSQEAKAGLVEAVDPAATVVPGSEFEPVPFVAPEAVAEPEPVADPEPASEPEPAPVALVTADDPAVPALPEGVDVEELWNAPTVDEPVRATVFPDPDPEPVALTEAPLVADVPAITEPVAAEEPAGIVPVWSALVPARPAAQPAAQPVEASAAPSMWDTHPLTHPGTTPVRELPAEPAQRALPRPDLSGFLATQPTPNVGQAPQTTTEAPTTTGAILRPLAEPQAGGGARHFRWVHLAVIGAIAFVLGVLAWNIARSNS